jgi:adenylate kinase
MIYITLGVPGAGKGAIARKLKSFFNFDILATGEYMRDEVLHDTPLGQRIKQHVLEGTFVEDDIAIELFKEHLDRNKDVIIEGFPRNMKQLKALEEILDDNGLRIEAALYFDVSPEIAKDRIEGRLVCPNCHAVYHATYFPTEDGTHCTKCNTVVEHRMDDTPENIANRIKYFYSDTYPLVDYYKELGLLRVIDANQSTMDMYYQVLETSQKFTSRAF